MEAMLIKDLILLLNFLFFLPQDSGVIEAYDSYTGESYPIVYTVDENNVYTLEDGINGSYILDARDMDNDTWLVNDAVGDRQMVRLRPLLEQIDFETLYEQEFYEVAILDPETSETYFLSINLNAQYVDVSTANAGRLLTVEAGTGPDDYDEYGYEDYYGYDEFEEYYGY